YLAISPEQSAPTKNPRLSTVDAGPPSICTTIFADAPVAVVARCVRVDSSQPTRYPLPAAFQSSAALKSWNTAHVPEYGPTIVSSCPPLLAASLASWRPPGQSMRAVSTLPFMADRTTSPSSATLTLENGSPATGCTVNDRCGSGLSSLNNTSANAPA